MPSNLLRLIVTGRNGQVARALSELSGPASQLSGLSVVATARPEFDLAAKDDVTGLIAKLSPDVIVNAGAYTAVDKAESEREIAFSINAEGAYRVAQAANQLGIPVIQLSTDYVFDGCSTYPYTEEDETGPINHYGATKLAGERMVREATPNHVILRTSWVYAPFGQNFVLTMLRIGKRSNDIRVVADQHGSPTSALDIASTVVGIARRLTSNPQDHRLRGTFHLANEGVTTWAGFASEVFRIASEHGEHYADVVPIPTSEYVTPAKRPISSRLNTTKLATIYGLQPQHWTKALRVVMRRIANPNLGYEI